MPKYITQTRLVYRKPDGTRHVAAPGEEVELTEEQAAPILRRLQPAGASAPKKEAPEPEPEEDADEPAEGFEEWLDSFTVAQLRKVASGVAQVDKYGRKAEIIARIVKATTREKVEGFLQREAG